MQQTVILTIVTGSAKKKKVYVFSRPEKTNLLTFLLILKIRQVEMSHPVGNFNLLQVTKRNI